MTPHQVRRGHARTLCAAAVLACTACVSPAPTTSVYEAKAGLTARDATSAASTAVLAARSFERNRVSSQALEVSLQSAENSLDSVTSTFDSVQPPPTKQADALRQQLDNLLSAAQDDASTLRIAARRSDDRTMRTTATSLERTTRQLQQFATEHSS